MKAELASWAVVPCGWSWRPRVQGAAHLALVFSVCICLYGFLTPENVLVGSFPAPSPAEQGTAL